MRQPFPLRFAEPIFVQEVPSPSYDDLAQVSNAQGTGVTTEETATGGHGDTDTDQDD